ncbi:MAG: hypothetical protein GX620_16125 [Chloroflexi bacterium]|nr:hypothetical protein [Chloroflexota bacterium]
MRKLAIVVGLVVFAILVSGLITATSAAPEEIPLLQNTETEPNNSFDEANPLPVPGHILGAVSTTIDDTLDYFHLEGIQVGKQYQASLTIDSPQGLNLRLVLWNGDRQYIDTSSSSASNITLVWTSSTSSAYVRVEAVTVTTTTVRSANYRLDVFQTATTPTPTNTPPPGADAYEPNDTKETAYYLPVSTSASANNANFWPVGDVDWYAFYVKNGRRYRASTSDLIGVDTYLEVYTQDGSRIGGDNDGGGGFASKLEWEATYDGYYFVRITNMVTSGPQDTYDLTVAEIGTPATSTPAPMSPVPGIDRCEPNGDFDHACVIPPNQSLTFNLISPYGAGPDNDYYKIWVKPGLHYECRTSDLSPGVDPNMIVYDQNRNALGGNDDVAPGDFNSAFSYYSTYSGWLYVLIGTGDRTPSDVNDSNYTLRCDTRVPGQPTATPAPVPAATSAPQATAARVPVPNATVTPAPGLTVRTLTTPGPAVTATPAPRFIPVDLLVYYDANGDRQPGAGEGITGVSVQAYEAATNQLLAQGFTDDAGSLRFTVSAQGPARIVVPFFGFSQLVAGDDTRIYLRIPAH